MDQVKIGRFIAQLRLETGMTQEALGEKLGVTNKTVSRWENGNYMPGVEMLQLLSGTFQVSINELLCGDRLDEKSFRQEADNNLVAALNSNAFSIKERYAFWKKKWLKEHAVLIALCVVIATAAFAAAWMSSKVWLVGACPMAWLIGYMFLRNRMMIYIENKVYSTPNEP